MHARISTLLGLTLALSMPLTSQSPAKASNADQLASCAAGLVAIPAALAISGVDKATSTANPPTAVSSITDPAGLLVGAAKKKLEASAVDAAKSAAASAGVTPASAAAQFACVTAAQALAYIQAAQARGPGQSGAAATSSDVMKSGVTTALAATPTGTKMTGAMATAPVAGGALKSLSGRFNRGESKESMMHDLGSGRLQVKGIRFRPGSDEPLEGFDQAIAMLGEALQAVDGRFVLNLPAESDGKSEPDIALATRRLTLLVTHLQLAGVPEARFTTSDQSLAPSGNGKPPKPGEARVEIVRAEQKP